MRKFLVVFIVLCILDFNHSKVSSQSIETPTDTPTFIDPTPWPTDVEFPTSTPNIATWPPTSTAESCDDYQLPGCRVGLGTPTPTEVPSTGEIPWVGHWQDWFKYIKTGFTWV